MGWRKVWKSLMNYWEKGRAGWANLEFDSPRIRDLWMIWEEWSMKLKEENFPLSRSISRPSWLSEKKGILYSVLCILCSLYSDTLHTGLNLKRHASSIFAKLAFLSIAPHPFPYFLPLQVKMPWKMCRLHASAAPRAPVPMAPIAMPCLVYLKTGLMQMWVLEGAEEGNKGRDLLVTNDVDSNFHVPLRIRMNILSFIQCSYHLHLLAIN